MIVKLANTDAREIAASLLSARRSIGPASGMVFTLVVVSELKHHEEVLEAAVDAGRTHPSRIIVVAVGEDQKRQGPVLDAELHCGESLPGDLIVLHLLNGLVEHGDSVVLPLLLPDSPTVVWWPHLAPDNLANDPIGRLATRRVTDAAGTPDPLGALRTRARNHTLGDTDLTWTRLTPWRALLAASLDQYPCQVVGATVEASPNNAPALLMRAWLGLRLGVEVAQVDTAGPGITGVRLKVAKGEIAILRDGSFTAQYMVPGQVRRSVALKRRNMTQLITEELQHGEPDSTFEEVLDLLAQED